MITKEFGLLGTTQDQILYKIFDELRKQNELLASLVQSKEEEKPKKAKGVKKDVGL
jgi:hypothetical protein